MVSEGRSPIQRAATLAVIVAALGYFVDIYDLILFGMVRNASVTDVLTANGIAATKDALTDNGLYLFNMQMGGMLVGGILSVRIAVAGGLVIWAVVTLPLLVWIQFHAGSGAWLDCSPPAPRASLKSALCSSFWSHRKGSGCVTSLT